MRFGHLLRFPLMVRYRALVASLVYLVLAGVWIVFSGSVAEPLAGWGADSIKLEMIKGLLFALTSAVALYMVLDSWPAILQSGRASNDVAADADAAGRKSRFPIVILICLALALVGGGWLVFDALKANQMQKIEDSLAAVSRLKSDQIDGWLKQSKTNVDVLTKKSAFADRADRWMRQGAPPGKEAQWLRQRLEFLRVQGSYGELTLIDLRGKPRMSTDMPLPDMAPDQALIMQATEQGRTLAGDLRWDDYPGGRPFISLPIAAPLILDDGSVAGVIWAEVDASHFLFPLIQSWPTPSKSAETLLFRIDGDEVLFLNQLRHRHDAALSLRISLDDRTSVLAVQAARGVRGHVRGLDYRGEPVIGHALKVPGMEWILIAKMDESEVFGPVGRLAWVTSAIVLLLLTVAGFSLILWWRQRNSEWEMRDAQHRAAQLESALRQKRLDQQFDYLTRYANDIILLLDEAGNVVEANERAEAAYQYSRQELLGKNIRQLRASSDLSVMEGQFGSVKSSKPLLFETTHIRGDGTEFPVEVNSRSIQTDEGLFVQSIIRDITERMAAQKRERRLTSMYSALGLTNEAIIHLKTENELFAEVCRIAVEKGGMMLAWVGVPDEGGCMSPVARFGCNANLLEGASVVSSFRSRMGNCPAAVAFREGKAVILSDPDVNEMDAPCAEGIAHRGIRSVSAIPVRRAGQPYAILVVFSADPSAFDVEIIHLLEEIAGNIGFALDNFDREAARTRAEAEIRQREQDFRALIEGLPKTNVARFDEQGRFVYASHGIERNFGIPVNRLKGCRPTETAFDQEFARVLEEAVEKVISTGSGTGFQYAYRTVTGLSHREFTLIPERVEDGRVRTVLQTSYDITELKLMEQQLRRRTEEMETLMDLAPVAIWVANDPQCNDIVGNITANEFYRTEKGENVSANVTGVRRFFRNGRELKSNELPMQEAAARNADVRDVELDVLLPSGDWMFMWGSASPLHDESGRVRGCVGAYADITSLKKVQQELQQLNARLEEHVRARTAELEMANRELEAFSYSVSHDLRTPLRGIDGFSKLLLEKYQDRLDATARDYLNRVRAAATRMGQLIDDLLDLSRIGRTEMRRMPVNLSAIAATIVESLRQREPQRNVSVDIASGMEAEGDPGLLRILLENLLGNAWKFTGKTAQAGIEMGMTVLDGKNVFHVRDNGAGFDMRYVGKLFAPFQRLHNVTDFPGTGIGLAIVQRIVARHGGQVWVEATENRGAVFFFILGEAA